MLISLGYHCNITFLNSQLKIKKETCVFEYFESRKLQYITDIINTLTNNPNQNVIFGVDYNVFLLNSNFYSCHYKLYEYEIIFPRRYKRFMDILINEENIYFVRCNTLNQYTTKNEIELFIESIRRINPYIKITFLIIDVIDSINELDINNININIDNVIFHHKYFFQKDIGNDIYYKDSPIILENYRKMLIDIDYNINDIHDMIFDDKSDI